jgi:hypothetical protein
MICTLAERAAVAELMLISARKLAAGPTGAAGQSELRGGKKKESA